MLVEGKTRCEARGRKVRCFIKYTGDTWYLMCIEKLSMFLYSTFMYVGTFFIK